ncbi:MAG: hypothetical protein A2Z25_14695 [Planctomycetes bacterium RBG_16_55_9]|nr:MAG: hypothetical protein A2Z25_14695 [Planctomycetes bacterium RBG_16_55_9]
MSTRKVILGLAMCLLIGVSGQKLLSQSARRGGMGGRMSGSADGERLGRMSPQERIEHFQKMAEDQRKWIEEQQTRAMQQALGVDDLQWKIIEPKLKKVQACREEAFVGTKPPFQSSFSSSSGQDGFAGGFQFQFGGSTNGPGVQSSSWADANRQPTDGEAILQELQLLVQDPQAGPDDITRGLDALRQARARGKQKWASAQQELRQVLDLRQQATLTMMGLLE